MPGTAIFALPGVKICMTQSQQHAEDLETPNTKADAGCWLGNSRGIFEMRILFDGATQRARQVHLMSVS